MKSSNSWRAEEALESLSSQLSILGKIQKFTFLWLLFSSTVSSETVLEQSEGFLKVRFQSCSLKRLGKWFVRYSTHVNRASANSAGDNRTSFTPRLVCSEAWSHSL